MLDGGASDEVCLQAAVANQTEWFARTAEADGGVVRREEGVAWTSTSASSVFAFPRLSKEQLDLLLPRFLDDASGAASASCWSLLPTQPPELGAELHAAGFRDGWQAHWMACALDGPLRTEAPAGVRIGVSDERWRATDLPWDGADITSIRSRLTPDHPRRVWHVGAWRAEVPVGHGTLSVTVGPLGVAGIYDMGVAEPERRRGIGRALTAALLELGRDAGCAYATLNATPDGERLYRTLGFRSVGVAQTWWR